MGAHRLGAVVLGTIALQLLSHASAGLQPALPPPRPHTPLVQAELDYLPAAQRRITLEVSAAEPAAVLRQIREQSGLLIEVQGSLPKHPTLSAAYRETETKVVLEWFAEQLPLTFRAEPPNTLWIVVDDRGKSTRVRDAS